MKKLENSWIILGGIIAAVAVITPFCIIALTSKSFDLLSFEKLGTVGDFFGGTTVGLLSLASMFFVIAAIVMQKKELVLQREELHVTNEEFKTSNKEFETNNKTLKAQQFDSIFFNLVNLHHQKVSEIPESTNIEKITYKLNKGKEEFFIEKILMDMYRNWVTDLNDISKKVHTFENLKEFYKEMYEKYIYEYKTDEPDQYLNICEHYKEFIFLGKEDSIPGEYDNLSGEDIEKLNGLRIDITEDYDINDFEEIPILVQKINSYLTEDKYKEYFCKYYNWFETINTRYEKEFKEEYQNEYIESHFKSFSTPLDHYFRSTYSIIDLYFTFDDVTSSRKEYMNILRTQFSVDELYLIYLNEKYIKKDQTYIDKLGEIQFFNEVDEKISEENSLYME